VLPPNHIFTKFFFQKGLLDVIHGKKKKLTKTLSYQLSIIRKLLNIGIKLGFKYKFNFMNF